MKLVYWTIALLTMTLLVTSCKTKAVSTSADDLVTMTLKPGLTPGALLNRSPFTIVEEKQTDKKTNAWLAKFDLGKYKMQDLVNYLINLDQVVTVNGIEKDVTPPVGPRAKPKTSKM